MIGYTTTPEKCSAAVSLFVGSLQSPLLPDSILLAVYNDPPTFLVCS